jgi:hypothetical protein
MITLRDVSNASATHSWRCPLRSVIASEVGRVILRPMGRTGPRKWSTVTTASVRQPNWSRYEEEGSIRRTRAVLRHLQRIRLAPAHKRRTRDGWSWRTREQQHKRKRQIFLRALWAFLFQMRSQQHTARKYHLERAQTWRNC